MKSSEPELICINLAELANQPHQEIPGKFFAYINKQGYVAFKHYTTKLRYKELRDSEPPIFIPAFQASGSRAAKKYIKNLLEKTLNLSWNNWHLCEKEN